VAPAGAAGAAGAVAGTAGAAAGAAGVAAASAGAGFAPSAAAGAAAVELASPAGGATVSLASVFVSSFVSVVASAFFSVVEELLLDATGTPLHIMLKAEKVLNWTATITPKRIQQTIAQMAGTVNEVLFWTGWAAGTAASGSATAGSGAAATGSACGLSVRVFFLIVIGCLTSAIVNLQTCYSGNVFSLMV